MIHSIRDDDDDEDGDGDGRLRRGIAGSDLLFSNLFFNPLPKLQTL